MNIQKVTFDMENKLVTAVVVFDETIALAWPIKGPDRLLPLDLDGYCDAVSFRREWAHRISNDEEQFKITFQYWLAGEIVPPFFCNGDYVRHALMAYRDRLKPSIDRDALASELYKVVAEQKENARKALESCAKDWLIRHTELDADQRQEAIRGLFNISIDIEDL